MVSANRATKSSDSFPLEYMMPQSSNSLFFFFFLSTPGWTQIGLVKIFCPFFVAVTVAEEVKYSDLFSLDNFPLL